MTHYKETSYGFEYGAAKIERMMSDEVKGWATLGLTTPKHERAWQIYVTKTGKVRIWNPEGKEMKVSNE